MVVELLIVVVVIVVVVIVGVVVIASTNTGYEDYEILGMGDHTMGGDPGTYNAHPYIYN